MLDKTILDHVEKMQEKEDLLKEDIDNIIKHIDLDVVIENPQEALQEVADYISEYIQDKYFEDASKNGFAFAKDVKRDGKIEIPKSNDPQLNKDVFDD